MRTKPAPSRPRDTARPGSGIFSAERVLIAALASMLVTGCGDGSADGGGSSSAASLQPAPDARPVQLPDGVVATVAGAEVTRAEFDRVYAARARGLEGSGGSRAERRRRREALVGASMSELIQAEGVAARAAAAGVSVSNAQVSAALDRMRESYDRPALWRRFLKRSGQTESYVRARLRSQLLNRRLYARQRTNAPETARTAQRRLRKATECRPGYVVALCANAPTQPLR